MLQLNYNLTVSRNKHNYGFRQNRVYIIGCNCHPAWEHRHQNSIGKCTVRGDARPPAIRITIKYDLRTQSVAARPKSHAA